VFTSIFIIFTSLLGCLFKSLTYSILISKRLISNYYGTLLDFYKKKRTLEFKERSRNKMNILRHLFGLKISKNRRCTPLHYSFF